MIMKKYIVFFLLLCLVSGAWLLVLNTQHRGVERSPNSSPVATPTPVPPTTSTADAVYTGVIAASGATTGMPMLIWRCPSSAQVPSREPASTALSRLQRERQRLQRENRQLKIELFQYQTELTKLGAAVCEHLRVAHGMTDLPKECP